MMYSGSRLGSWVVLGVLGAGMAAGLSACMNVPPEVRVKDRGHYWQRAETTSALYMRGPKAQQMLNQNISDCVVSLRELERLEAIRENIPAQTRGDGSVPDPATPEGRLSQWETPERKGYLHYEHLPYHDFETCMRSKGWERVEHVPYDVSRYARDVYVETITGRKYQSRVGEQTPAEVQSTRGKQTDFDTLNR